MENKNNEQSGFSYTYSAKEQAELKKIREKYTPPTEKGSGDSTRVWCDRRAYTWIWNEPLYDGNR